MSSVLGLAGYNKSAASSNVLLAAYGNDVVNLSTGLGYGLALTGNNVEMESFLDRIFLQDYSTRPKTFNGTAWSFEYVGRTPIAKYLKNYREKSRIYLGNCKFIGPQVPNDLNGNPLIFPSRVFYPDLWVGNNLTWGIEWGTNGKTVAGSPYFDLALPLAQDFKASNIKIGDPLFITSGNTQLASKFYTVASVESPYRLRMTENFPVTATSLHYWVGSNWFDIATDDNDQITGFGENSTRLLVFKLMSLWYYNGTQKKQIKDAPGTSAHRSIINKRGYTYYFHGSDPLISGIYRHDGVGSTRVSRAIDPFIRGMSTDNYDNVVAWEEGESLRWYLGDITNTNYGISMTNAVATLNTVTNAWDVSPIDDVITCSTTFRTNNRRDTYCGTSDDAVHKMGSGNSFNGTPINMLLETKVYYPSGEDVINEYPRIQFIGRQTKGVKVKVRLWNNPLGVGEWKGIGELTNDRTELLLPNDYKLSSGIQLGFYENGTLENDIYIEKAIIFYKPSRVRL